MTELALRPATLDDVDAIVTLVTVAYRGAASRVGWTTEADLLDGGRTDRAEVTAAIESSTDPSGVVLLAVHDGALVGCVHVVPIHPDGAHIGMFAVDPIRQSSGTGSFLLTAAEVLAGRDWARSWVELEVLQQRPELIAWYHRRGYQTTGRTMAFPPDHERYGRPRHPDLRFDTLRRPL